MSLHVVSQVNARNSRAGAVGNTPAFQFEPNDRVCIAGGGLSGLYAGYLLAKQGLVVRVHESSDRLGGALHDVIVPNDRFMSQVFRSNHTRMHALLKELDIEATMVTNMPFLTMGEDNKLNAMHMPDVMHILADMNPNERIDSSENGVTSEMKRLPYYEEMRYFLAKDYIESEGGHASALFVPGGYLGLIRALTKAIVGLNPTENKVTTGSRITEIRHSTPTNPQKGGDGLIVTSSDKGAHFCRYFIAAIPKRELLELIEKSRPALEWARPVADAAIFVPSYRVYIHYETAVFEETDFKGHEMPFHVVNTDASFNWATFLSPQDVLVAYVDGRHAEHVKQMREQTNDDSTVVKTLLQSLLEYLKFPEERTQRLLGAEFRFKFSIEGAGFHPNTDPNFSQNAVFRNDSQNVALAGECTSEPSLRAWMEGALQAAERAVENLNTSSI